MIGEQLGADVAALSDNEVVQRILEVVRRATGMRMALVTRVTEDSWTACAVNDGVDFGLAPGDALPFENTY